jgi:hypothetical protein
MLSVFALAIMICLISCKKDNDSTLSLSSQIVGKWTIKEAIGNYTNYGVNSKDTTRFTTADYFEFRADSTLTIVVTGSTYNGKWKITNDRLYITETNYFDYRSGHELPILTNTELQLYNTETIPDHYLEQKLNLYR